MRVKSIVKMRLGFRCIAAIKRKFISQFALLQFPFESLPGIFYCCANFVHSLFTFLAVDGSLALPSLSVYLSTSTEIDFLDDSRGWK